MAFDDGGHLFIADAANSNRLLGIDAVDGVFFNGDDLLKLYSMNVAGFYDIAFGPDGRLYAIDQRNLAGTGEDVLIAFRPSPRAEPTPASLPSSLALLGVALVLLSAVSRKAWCAVAR